MRVLPLVVFGLLFAACSQASLAPPASKPAVSAAEPAPLAEGVCGDTPPYLINTVRSNASLAGSFYQEAQTARTPEAARQSYCAAAVYLRWLLANDPTFTGSEPDDRHFRRMADAHEYFAGLPDADRRAHLDSAVALRAQADELRQELRLPFDAWASDLRSGVFYATYADLYEDAPRREFESFDRAFRSAPDQIDDWYLRRLLELSVDFFETCEERADYLRQLAEHVDDSDLRGYVEAVAVCTPFVPMSGPMISAWMIEEFESGGYVDCDPQADVRSLVGLSARYPDLVTEAGGDPDAIIDALLDCVAEPETSAQAFALFVRSWNRDDRERAEAYFQQALDMAESNRQRADFFYLRAIRGLGDRARLIERGTSADPAHGPLLYLRATRMAETIGEPRGVQTRAAYWCLADEFNRVAATGDPRVADTARRQATAYLQAAPTREQYIFETDWMPGDAIRARAGGVSCTTRVR